MSTPMTSAPAAQAGQPSPFEAFRAGFPAFASQTYLSICDKMILHRQVRAAVETFLDHLENASAIRTDHEVKVLTAREKFARLVNVAPETVAATRNVSDGINSVAWAMPWQPGDNVVLTADAEHPNNIYPWLRQRQRGVEIRMVPPLPDGAIDTDGLLAAIDGKTRLVTAATATFAPGHRTDLRPLGERCRKDDIFLLVDGVQTAGIFRHDMQAEGIDGFATSASKGLLGLYGFGFLYVSPRWIDRLSPAYLSRAGVKQLTDDHSTMGGFDYEYQDGARRFEVGSFNLAGAYAADTSLQLLLDLGPEAIQAHVLELAGRLHAGVRALGIEPAVPGSGPRQSHILTLGQLDAGGHGFSSDPIIQPLSDHLKANQVIHTIRRGQLRIGLHAYNNAADIDRALDVMREGLAAARRTQG